MKENIENYINKNICTGCMSCLNSCSKNCITKERGILGEICIRIDEGNCIECRECIKVCPLVNTSFKNKKECSRVIAGYNIDESERLKSSSGGIFPLLAKHQIDNGGVVCAARYDESFSVIYDCFDDKASIERFIKSKYVESCPSTVYSKIKYNLEEKKPVLFVGLPCHVAGLKTFLQKDYDQLFTVDIICHGVGTEEVWKDYLKEYHPESIKSIDFKNKEKGWNREQIYIEYNNGNTYKNSPSKDAYAYGFGYNIFLRSSCYNCNFKGLKRYSDLTIGDAWGIDNIKPDLFDNRGCSVIFIHTNKGIKLVDDIKHNIKYAEVDIYDMLFHNKRMISSVDDNDKRVVFAKDYKVKNFKKCVHDYMRK